MLYRHMIYQHISAYRQILTVVYNVVKRIALSPNYDYLTGLKWIQNRNSIKVYGVRD
ncbi:unnamed protein product [Trichobilharzia regenti]|nr:unnamed protein product [Trichobilharzia regenti]